MRLNTTKNILLNGMIKPMSLLRSLVPIYNRGYNHSTPSGFNDGEMMGDR